MRNFICKIGTGANTLLHSLFTPKYLNSLLFFLLMLTFGLSSWAIKARAMSDKNIQEGIANEILRFHVIANSDSEEDQKLKLLVKDTLVDDIAPLVKDAADLAEVTQIAKEHLSDIKALAEEIIRQRGYHYDVRVTLEKCYFPLKIYGKYTFPPGYYQALRVRIGKAEGKNWWCVMFPPLCFVDETYSIVDEASGDKLMNLLTEEEYDSLVSSKTPVKIRFKLFDRIKELLGKE
jgi:stage II sporulation protein R